MTDPADDALGMLRAGWTVAAVAVPVAILAAAVVRLRGKRVCPRWSAPGFVWSGPVILGFFFCHLVVSAFLVTGLDSAGLFRLIYPNGEPPLPEGLTPPEANRVTHHLKAMWVSLGFVPLVLMVALVVRTAVYAAPPRVSARSLLRVVSLGTAVWLTFGTAAYVLNLLLAVAFDRLDIPVTEHPLSKLGPTGDGVGGWLFVLSACVAAPLMEEFLFRGLLVDWGGGRWYRPWVLLAVAVVVAGTSGSSGPLTFVAVLGGGLYLIQRFGKRVRRFPKRTATAIWGTSALFASVHSSVWPSPIPLFVLALGLGYLTARTRSWLPAAVAHGLFNLVSTLFVFAR